MLSPSQDTQHDRDAATSDVLALAAHDVRVHCTNGRQRWLIKSARTPVCEANIEGSETIPKAIQRLAPEAEKMAAIPRHSPRQIGR